MSVLTIYINSGGGWPVVAPRLEAEGKQLSDSV